MHCCAEPLESRIAPAAILHVTYQQGNLTIVGDGNVHQFSLDSTGGVSARLSVFDDTMIQIGNAPPTSTPLDLPSLTGDVRITLGNSEDDPTFSGAIPIRNFYLHLGGGNNFVNFGDLDVRGSFTLLGGKDTDSISFGGSEESIISIGGNMMIRTGQGDASVSFAATRFEVGGNLRFQGGSANDEFGTNVTSLHVGGDASFLLGRGQDLLALVAEQQSDIAGRFNVIANSGIGTNTSVSVSVNDRFRFGGDVTIATAGSDDSIDFSGGDLVFDGNLKFSSGNGVDTFEINALTARVTKSVFVNCGLSLNANFNVPNGLSIGGNLVVLGGIDSDAFALDAQARIFGHTLINLGRGSFHDVNIQSSNSDVDSVFVGGLDVRFSGSSGPDGSSGSVSIQQAVLGGKSSIYTGIGNDLVSLARITVNAPFTVATGNGSDALRWEADSAPTLVAAPGSVIAAPLTVDLGAGDDSATFGSNGSAAGVEFKVPSLLLGGPGLDSLSRLNVSGVAPTVRQFEVVQ